MLVPINRFDDPAAVQKIFSDVLLGLSINIPSGKEMLIKRLMKGIEKDGAKDLQKIWNSASDKEHLDAIQIKKVCGAWFNDLSQTLRIDKAVGKEKLATYQKKFEDIIEDYLNDITGEKLIIEEEDFMQLKLKDIISKMVSTVRKLDNIQINTMELSNFAMKELAIKMQHEFKRGV